MKIVFFNRFFYPDLSATSQILSDLAFHLPRPGREIHVVTARTAADQPGNELIRGVHVHRVADANSNPPSLPARAAAYLDFYTGARRAARTLLDPGDIAVVKTDPPLLSVAVAAIARKRGSRVVVWLQDLFPEVAAAYGIPGMNSPIGDLLKRKRNQSLAVADRVVTIGSRMAAYVASQRCVPDDRLHIVHNWADGGAITPMSPIDSALRKQWAQQADFLVGYSGNLGRVHEFETLLDAAAALEEQSDIRFAISGRGPRLDEVRGRVAAQKLSNVAFEALQDRSLLRDCLGAADVHLVILRPQYEGLVQPSKLYGVMAAGRPTIFVGDVTGETAAILAEADAGISIRTGDAAALAAAILRLRDDASERKRLGMNARKAFESTYDMPIAFAKWESILGV